jgi:hypothetical protein
MKFGLLILSTLFAVMPLWSQNSEEGVSSASNWDLSIGYQSFDISGNESMFRSQINEDDGPILQNLELNLFQTKNAFLDRLRLRASGFGGAEHGFFHLELEKDQRYKASLKGRHLGFFNAIPGYADPVSNHEAVAGQHTMDRTRHLMDFELKLFPHQRLTPFVGFTMSEYSGPAQTTYHVGQDEFQVTSDLEETEQEFRLGLDLDFQHFSGGLVQGWRDVEGDETITLLDGANDGNQTVTLLGEEIMLSDLNGTTQYDAKTPYTQAFFTATPHKAVQIVFDYVYADMETDLVETETLNGNLASFALRRFYGMRTETGQNRAENPSWRGRLRLQGDLGHGFDYSLQFAKHHRELTGFGLIETLYQDTLTFGHLDDEDFLVSLETDTVMEVDQQQLEAVIGKTFGHWRLYVGAYSEKDETLVDQSLAEIVVSGSQEGTFERQVDHLVGGLNLRLKGLVFNLDYQKQEADQAVFRADFLDREKLSLQVRWKLADFLQLKGSAQQTDSENNHPEVAFTSDLTTYRLDALAHFKNVQLQAGYGIFDLESLGMYRQPQDYSMIPSHHLEDGEELSALLRVDLDRVDLQASFSRFDNEGALTFNYDRLACDLHYKVTKAWFLTLGYRQDDYQEALHPIADYQADRFSLLVRWFQ